MARPGNKKSSAWGALDFGRARKQLRAI